MPGAQDTPPAYYGANGDDHYVFYGDYLGDEKWVYEFDLKNDGHALEDHRSGPADAQTLVDIETAHSVKRQGRVWIWMELFAFIIMVLLASASTYLLAVQWYKFFTSTPKVAMYGQYGIKNQNYLDRRQAYSYGGEHPTVTITGLPSVTTGHLTVSSTSAVSVTISTTVSTDVAETTSTGLNVTTTETSGVVSTSIQTPEVSNVTTTGTEIQGGNMTITEVATSTSAGIKSVTPFNPGPHSWINSTGSITHSVPVTGVTGATGASTSTSIVNGTVTSDADTIVPLTSTVNITVTLSPVPLWTTGGSDAATGTVSNTTTFTRQSVHWTVPTSTVMASSTSEVNSTVTTHGTVYTTVTETVSPSDNCTLTESVSAFSTSGSDAVTGTATSTSSSRVMNTITRIIPEPESTSTFSNTFTSTETETVTPVYTIQMTKSVTEGDVSISVYTVTTVNVNTITVTIPQTTSTSSTEPCGEPETDTVTTTVISTVWGVAPVTSSSVPASTETVSIGYSTTVTENAGESSTTATSSHTCDESESKSTGRTTLYPPTTTTTVPETTITSYVILNGTLTRTAGGVDGITASHLGANSSTVTTDEYTLTTLPTTSSEVPEVIVSTIITTITTMTGSSHPHSVSAISTTTTTAGMWYPESFNGTGLTPPLNSTDMGNMTYRPETLPIGPAGYNSTEPMIMNGTTMVMSMPASSSWTKPTGPSKTTTQSVISTTASSSAARRQPRVDAAYHDGDDVLPIEHCIVMFVFFLVVVLPAELYLFSW
ncbi:hypothetical protein F5B19DRAFT_493999 [Rostrohypoxylon terebratum]|nr:hypothetical protein F5B19DRAFT_493999 [Rostrohypoxylon terebratum]